MTTYLDLWGPCLQDSSLKRTAPVRHMPSNHYSTEQGAWRPTAKTFIPIMRTSGLPFHWTRAQAHIWFSTVCNPSFIFFVSVAFLQCPLPARLYCTTWLTNGPTVDSVSLRLSQHLLPISLSQQTTASPSAGIHGRMLQQHRKHRMLRRLWNGQTGRFGRIHGSSIRAQLPRLL
jgi:hypothetical protein